MAGDRFRGEIADADWIFVGHGSDQRFCAGDGAGRRRQELRDDGFDRGVEVCGRHHAVNEPDFPGASG